MGTFFWAFGATGFSSPPNNVKSWKAIVSDSSIFEARGSSGSSMIEPPFPKL